MRYTDCMSDISEPKKNLRQKFSSLEKEVVGKTMGYLVGAFGLVAALAWNDFVEILFAQFFPNEQQTIFAKLVYALVATIIALAVILGLNRWMKKV